jgi:FKBP-type peptidyl-prolyl cis-trans isomerase
MINAKNIFHKIKLLIILGGVMLFNSCSSPFPEYESTQSGIYYKYHKIGEEKEQPSYTDYVTVNIKYKTIKDSIFFEAKRRFQINKPNYLGAIDECFTMLSVGDSASFVLLTEPFFKQTLQQTVPSFLSSNQYFIVDVEMLDFISEEQFVKEKEEFLAWIEDFAIYEKTKLNNYLSDCTNDYQMDGQGLYKMIIDEGDSLTVKAGDTLVLDYEGRFMNGKIFDSTIKRKRTFEYIYGTEWQVIKGMEIAVSKMKMGEKSIFILPSELAFGQQGNSNGAIPPFSTLIYEIKLIQIRR